jgi:hypothetical protein
VGKQSLNYTGKLWKTTMGLAERYPNRFGREEFEALSSPRNRRERRAATSISRSGKQQHLQLGMPPRLSIGGHAGRRPGRHSVTTPRCYSPRVADMK